MRIARLTALALLPLSLAACSGGDAAPTESTAPTTDSAAPSVEPSTEESQGSASAAPSPDSTEELPSMEPLPSDNPVQEPTTSGERNQDERWDDWNEQELPAADEVQGTMQFTRLEFVDEGEIHGHIRVVLPESMIADDGVEFCPGGELPPEYVGFGEHWAAEPSEMGQWRICDTVGTFALDEWGGEAAVLPQPTFADGEWNVDFGERFAPDDQIGLYRFRMEFPGPVIEHSEGGVVDGNAVTWRDAQPISATAGG